jgi:hypothetical protein
VIYSAIFGAYDAPPDVSAADPSISYILFCDDTVTSAPAPWELRRVPAVFIDPQRDARRVKALPHLFLPDHFDVSVWIDSNCRILALDAATVLGMLGDASLAVPRHAERGCIFEEAKVLLALNYDSPARIARQIAAYELVGFPHNFGLHHTNFLIRPHRNEACIRFCNEWWQEISRHSKRDQLSFDYVRWRLPQTEVRSIPIDYTLNPHFHTFGFHRNPRRMITEHLEVGVRSQDLTASFLAASYVSHYDVWPAAFIRNLRRLNDIVRSTGEQLEGNLCYFHHQQDSSYAPPDPRRGARRETFLRALAGRRRMFEIGFNAGHSSLLALTHTDISVTSVDVATHTYTEPAADYLSEMFPGRFQFAKMDTRQLPAFAQDLDLGGHDMVHIDGGHTADAFACDIATALAFGAPDTLVLIDDIYLHPIRRMIDRLTSDRKLARYGNLETIESGAYIVLETPGRADAEYHTVLVDRLLKDTEWLLDDGGGIHSNFVEELTNYLVDGDANADEITKRVSPTSPASLPCLDAGFIAEIQRIGFHPFIMVRAGNGNEGQLYVVCETQNETSEFAARIAESPSLGSSKLLCAIDRALRFDIGESAKLFHAWTIDDEMEQSESICLELPQGLKLPAYYGYPVFDLAKIPPAVVPNLRVSQLIALREAYEAADGNNRSRLALVEALTLAEIQHLGIHGQFTEAAKLVARAFKSNPSSHHLRAAINTLELRSGVSVVRRPRL